MARISTAWQPRKDESKTFDDPSNIWVYPNPSILTEKKNGSWEVTYKPFKHSASHAHWKVTASVRPPKTGRQWIKKTFRKPFNAEAFKERFWLEHGSVLVVKHLKKAAQTSESG